MEIFETTIQDVLLIKPRVFTDDRGFFFESYNSARYKDSGIKLEFLQDNISKSVLGTIRGLHYQTGKFAQGKLCSVLFGRVLDVAVDIRFGSPTFGKFVSIELSDENNYQLWIPPGFAHGFSVLSEEAIFQYKCTQTYSKESERCIIYNDEILGIDWKTENPLLSGKDLTGLNISDIEKDFIY
jgi:dTDP-4-dehydrorhamnose 3,5-epimerase